MTTVEMIAATKFFSEHAGWSYHPDHETPERGRLRGAVLLAYAEHFGRVKGWEVSWEVDTNAMWDDAVERESTDYDQYGAVLRNKHGKVLGSLWSIDFGPDESPETATYARVVAAELMWEAMP